jgi:hypothetical protein
MTSMLKIPVIVCIDVEPEAREIDPYDPADWTGFVSAYHFFSQLRPKLEGATGAPVRFSWFFRMDPQIEHTYSTSSWVVERYPEIFRGLESAGDELGLHTHAWRWDELSRRWVTDHGNQQWINHCVRISFEAFQRAMGRPCRSFRFGDHWMNNETMRLLEELGARFDLTLEPGRKAPRLRNSRQLSTGSLPDYRGVPRHPYRPSRSNFKEPGFTEEREIQVIPLSTAKPGRPTVRRLLNIKRAAKYCLSGFRDPMQLNPCFDVPDFCQMIDSILHRRKDAYLAPVLRVDGFSKPQERYNLERNFDHILNHPLAERLTFVTPATAIELLS